MASDKSVDQKMPSEKATPTGTRNKLALASRMTGSRDLINLHYSGVR